MAAATKSFSQLIHLEGKLCISKEGMNPEVRSRIIPNQDSKVNFVIVQKIIEVPRVTRAYLIGNLVIIELNDTDQISLLKIDLLLILKGNDTIIDDIISKPIRRIFFINGIHILSKSTDLISLQLQASDESICNGIFLSPSIIVIHMIDE